MKSPHGPDKYKLTEKIIIHLLIVIAILGLLGPLLLKQFNLFLLGMYLGVPMLSAPIIWLRLRTREIETLSINKSLKQLLIPIFLLCYSSSLLLLHHCPLRSLPYYILIAFMGVLLLLQILFETELSQKQNNIVLIQIIMLFMNIIWGVNLKYYFFIGRTDIFFHALLIENLLDVGFVNPTFDIYEAFPLWHVLSAMIYQIIDLPIQPVKVMFITNGLIYGCLVIVIFLIASKLLNSKIALLSALFLCFNTDAIFYGMYSIPRSVVFFLEGLLILILIQHKKPLNLAFLMIIIIGLIIYHTASMPFIILILTLLYILQAIYNTKKPDQSLNLNLLLLLFVTTLTYWMYAGVKVFNSIVQSLLIKAPTGVLTKSIVETPLQELFNYLQYTPLLLFIILGALWGLRTSELNSFTKIFLVMGILLVPVTFPGPALLLNKLAGNFNLARFGEYSFLFICITGAAGIYTLFNKVKAKNKAYVIILFFIMALLAVSNDFIASDNPLIKRPFYTFYLSEEEDISIMRVAEQTEGYLFSDYISCRYLKNTPYMNKIHVLEVDQKQQKFLRSSSEDIILLRKNELLKRPLKLFTSPNGTFIFDPSLNDTLDYYDRDLPLWNDFDLYNTIYDSGTVVAFQ